MSAPQPLALPRRPAHLVGLCYPCPIENGAVRPFPHWLDIWRVTGLRALRVNAHHARPDIFEFLTFIAEHGLRPWPIIDLTRPGSNGDGSAVLDRELPEIVRLTKDIGARMPWISEIEVYNEPLSLGRLSPQNYARLCIAVGQAMREVNPDCRIYIACEHVSASAGTLHQHWTETKKLVPVDLYDGVAIHPYRAEANTSAFGSRRAEFQKIREAVPADKEIVCTEVGFATTKDSEARQGDELWMELEIQKELGINATFIYCHVGRDDAQGADLGIFKDVSDGAGLIVPRPAALRVMEFTNKYAEVTR